MKTLALAALAALASLIPVVPGAAAQAPAPVTHKVLSADGTPIAYTRQGSGPAVILVEGALSRRELGATSRLAPFLSPRFTVITYDRRGRGESGDTAPYAVERELEDLAALLKEAGGSAALAGFSSGAVLAAEAAARLPGVTKLAMYEAPLVVSEARAPFPTTYRQDLGAMLADGRRGDMVDYFMTHGVGLPPEMAAGMHAQPMWPMLEAVAHTVPYDFAVVEAFSLAGDAAAIKAPALVMFGSETDQWLKDAAQALAKAIPGAQLRTLEGQTHDVAPDALAPVLLQFFGA